MTNLWTLAWATYADLVRRPLYYLTLGAFALLVYGSSFLTQFTFDLETPLVREMGLASLVLWGFILVVVMAPVVVTQELEDRTAVTLLSKPVRRSAFLLGRFAGLMMALVPGLFVLGGVLFYTLWYMAKSTLFGDPALSSAFGWSGLAALVAGSLLAARARRRIRAAEEGTALAASRGPLRAGLALAAAGAVALLLALEFSRGDWGEADAGWQRLVAAGHSVGDYSSAFLRESGVVVLEGFVLAVLQVAVLAAVCTALCAFVPPVVSVSGTAFFYILGNLSAPMQASLERLDSAAVTWLGRALWVAVPDLGLFNLQTHFSEGRIVSPGYLGLATLHAVLYVAFVFTVACARFERREIR